jgi:hypothetical protein
MAQGDAVPDPAPAVALAEQTRVYPLFALEKDVKPMQFPNASGQRINMMYPTDASFWTKLKEFVDYEPVSAIDMELRGVLAGIGIVKGQPFEPTEKQRELLQRAVETAPRMLLALRQLGRNDERNLYYADRQAETALGRRHRRLRAGQLHRREPARRLLSVRLFLCAGHGHAYDQCGLEVPVHRPRRRRRLPERLEHLPPASAARPAGRAVLGGDSLQRHRWHDAGDGAASALDQWLL